MLPTRLISLQVKFIITTNLKKYIIIYAMNRDNRVEYVRQLIKLRVNTIKLKTWSYR